MVYVGCCAAGFTVLRTTMKSRITLILFVCLIVLAIIALFSLMLARFSRQTTLQQVFPTPTLVPIPLRNIPTGERLEVGGVSIKNPYTSAVQLSAQGDSLMTQSEGYQLIYLKQFSKFLISVTASPFEENRQQAEAALLSRLEIDEATACTLQVEITTIYDINPNEAGQIFSLSFCN